MKINNNIRFAIVVIVGLLVLPTFSGCIDFGILNKKANISQNTLFKGVNDVGFIYWINYKITPHMKIVLEWKDKPSDLVIMDKVQVTRTFSLDIQITGDGSEMVKYRDFNSEVGSKQNSFVAYDGFHTKQSYTFTQYKAMYFKTTVASYTSRSDNNESDYNQPTIYLEDNETRVLSGFMFVPPTLGTSFSLISSYPSQLNVNSMVTNIALDPNLLQVTTPSRLKDILHIKYGLSDYEWDKMMIKVGRFQYNLAEFKNINDRGFGSSSGTADNIVPTTSWDITKFRDEWKKVKDNYLKSATENVVASVPPMLTAEAIFEISITNLRGKEVTKVKISIPLPFSIISIKQAYNLAYDHLLKEKDTTDIIVGKPYEYETSNPDEIFFSFLKALQPPLSGKIPIFVPLKRVTSHLKRIHFTIAVKGVHFEDRYDTDEIGVPPIRVNGWSFTVLNNLVQYVCDILNGIRKVLGYYQPSYNKKEDYKVITIYTTNEANKQSNLKVI